MIPPGDANSEDKFAMARLMINPSPDHRSGLEVLPDGEPTIINAHVEANTANMSKIIQAPTVIENKGAVAVIKKAEAHKQDVIAKANSATTNTNVAKAVWKKKHV